MIFYGKIVVLEFLRDHIMNTSIFSTLRKEEIYSTAAAETQAIADQEKRKKKDQKDQPKKKSPLDVKISSVAHLKTNLLEELLLKGSLLSLRHILFQTKVRSKAFQTALLALGLKRNSLINHLFSAGEEKGNKYKRLLQEALSCENELLLEELLNGSFLEKRKIFYSSSYLINGCYLPATYPKEMILKR